MAEGWRPEPESNRRARICSPLRHHSAIGPSNAVSARPYPSQPPSARRFICNNGLQHHLLSWSAGGVTVKSENPIPSPIKRRSQPDQAGPTGEKDEDPRRRCPVSYTHLIDSIQVLKRIETRDQRRQFLLNQICFAACIEGLFFFAAFAYVYYFRSRGLLPGLASGTNWVFRDESCHMEFAFECVRTVREEEPELFDDRMQQQVYDMLEEAIECEVQFAEDVLSGGVAGISTRDMRQYLQHCADQHFAKLGMPKRYDVRNPLPFMELQDVQELTNFFERRVSAYQLGVQGEVGFDHAF